MNDRDRRAPDRSPQPDCRERQESARLRSLIATLPHEALAAQLRSSSEEPDRTLFPLLLRAALQRGFDFTGRSRLEGRGRMSFEFRIVGQTLYLPANAPDVFEEMLARKRRAHRRPSHPTAPGS